MAIPLPGAPGAGAADGGLYHPHPEVNALLGQYVNAVQGLAAHPHFGPVGFLGHGGAPLRSPFGGLGLGGAAQMGTGQAPQGTTPANWVDGIDPTTLNADQLLAAYPNMYDQAPGPPPGSPAYGHAQGRPFAGGGFAPPGGGVGGNPVGSLLQALRNRRHGGGL